MGRRTRGPLSLSSACPFRRCSHARRRKWNLSSPPHPCPPHFVPPQQPLPSFEGANERTSTRRMSVSVMTTGCCARLVDIYVRSMLTITERLRFEGLFGVACRSDGAWRPRPRGSGAASRRTAGIMKARSGCRVGEGHVRPLMTRVRTCVPGSNAARCSPAANVRAARPPTFIGPPARARRGGRRGREDENSDLVVFFRTLLYSTSHFSEDRRSNL